VRRLALLLILFSVLVTGSAAGQSNYDRKSSIDAKIAELERKIDSADRQEDVLSDEIAAVSVRIRSLEGEVAAASERVRVLESQLAASKNRLAALTQLFRLQTQKLGVLTEEQELAETRLNERLVEIYQSSDPTPVELVINATSFRDLLDQFDYLRSMGEQDKRIAGQVSAAREDVRVARLKTHSTRVEVERTTELIAERTERQRVERDRVLAAQQQLADVRAVKERSLASVQVSKRDYLHEVEGLQRASAALSARIQAAQRAAQAAAPSSSSSSSASAGASVVSASAPSAAGMVWPVSGPVTSGFGWRWGRMHEGIDIGAPTGAPIRAVAAGTVIYAGWMSGYGQLVVVDHGGGLATAYAHMSSMAAGTGQGVAQGQVIGYVGCTGHCFGSHLHFEVRVNGAAVDPLRYL
jgi:murein DD-endopeptidase MepM/ murein hydrolase activator NlpD